MATTYNPGTNNQYPDILGGQLTQTNGNPPFPGTFFTGPVIWGNVLSSDGSNNLAGVGETQGTCNTGYGVCVNTDTFTQATNTGTAGQYACAIVIPAQSQILHITIMVTTAFTGAATTFGIGTNNSATALTAANAVVTSGALGQISVTPGTGATQIGNWDNVGTQDVQIIIQSTNTGSGVANISVEYIPSINLAS
jgi:hypothetical protein